ncbi:hypothetical protein HDU87_000613, partial [Geranomyces variabilis]
MKLRKLLRPLPPINLQRLDDISFGNDLDNVFKDEEDEYTLKPLLDPPLEQLLQ